MKRLVSVEATTLRPAVLAEKSYVNLETDFVAVPTTGSVGYHTTRCIVIDDFALEVATQLDGLSGSTLENKCHEILDNGDFQGNIPELKDGVTHYVNEGDDQRAILLMWRAASKGLEAKARYA